MMRDFENLFRNLPIPTKQEGGEVFSAARIPGYEAFRVAKNPEGQPALLMPSNLRDGNWDNGLSPIRLKHIRIDPKLSCSIENEEFSGTESKMAVVSFVGDEGILYGYFCKVVQILVETVGPNPTTREMLDSIDKIVEIFRMLGKSSKESIQGLWAELFFIRCYPEFSVNLIDGWHNSPSDTYDFDFGSTCLEIKSYQGIERVHHFSIEQLNPPEGVRAMVVSLHVRQSISGDSISDLIEWISANGFMNVAYVEKLYRMVASTLGEQLEDGLQLKFDSTIAKDSVRFYGVEQIPKISTENVPNGVSDVRFKVNIESVPCIEGASVDFI